MRTTEHVALVDAEIRFSRMACGAYLTVACPGAAGLRLLLLWSRRKQCSSHGILSGRTGSLLRGSSSLLCDVHGPVHLLIC